MTSPKTYCSSAADTAKPILREAPILKISDDLARSLKHPCSRTLKLIDKALAWLRPFESPKASTASTAERAELLSLLDTHRLILSPYLNIDRIESNLRYGARSS